MLCPDPHPSVALPPPQVDDPDMVPGLRWTLDNDITDVLDVCFTVTRQVRPGHDNPNL